jgi:serine/threonine protein phosphatase PrpC
MSKVPKPAQLAITIAEQCDRGIVREENQDSVRHIRTPMGELLIVADGIGGYTGGATASRLVVQGFQSYFMALPNDYSVERAIRDASARANANVFEAANAPDSTNRRMGSTVVMALLQQDASGTQAWIGHVGDSRAYLVRDGVMSCITNDHSAVQALLNRNLITPEQALNHPDASVLTRSLGHSSEVEIDIDKVVLLAGDCLVLCSDGLWGYVDEEALQAVAANPNLTPEAASKALLDLALSAGGHDNIGIEFARLSLAPATPARKPFRFGFMEVLAVALLLFAAAGALAFYGTTHHWRHVPHLRH